MLTYLSNTSLKMFWSNPDDFYIQYVLGERAPMFGGDAMDIGTIFDNMVKCSLAEELGIKGVTPEVGSFSVEATRKGLECYEKYVKSGAYAMLLEELRANDNVKLDLDITLVIDGVPMRGKPDLQFVSSDGVLHIRDWKTSGWVSETVRKGPGSWVWNNGVQSPDSMEYRGTRISTDTLKSDWSQQTNSYVLLCQGSTDESIVGIEYVSPIEVAKYRTMTIKSELQKLLDKYKRTWEMICGGHYFHNLSLEDSKKRADFLSVPENRILYR